MPFERRDIAERTVFPKHLFSVPAAVVQILGGAGTAERVYEVDVAAEIVPTPSGLYALDGVVLTEGMLVFSHAGRYIYEASAGSWRIIRQVEGPALVLVRTGTRFGGSMHSVYSDGSVRCHFAYVGRSGSVLYSLTPTDWTPVQLTEELVPSRWVTPAPFELVVGDGVDGLYALFAHAYVEPTGATGGFWTGTVELAVLQAGLPIPTEQPFDVQRIVTPGQPLVLQAALLWRIVLGVPYTLALRSTPAGEFAVKAYVGLHRLL